MPRSARRPRPQRPFLHPKDMTFGDVLYRLALVAPEQYHAIEALTRSVYVREWPLEDDPVKLLERAAS